MDGDDPQQILLDFFRALADPDRLRVAAALIPPGQRIDDLAGALALPRREVVRHLTLLTDAGLVRESGNGPEQVYRLDLDALQAMRRAILTRPERLPESAAGLDDQRRNVLRAFLDGDQLRSIPADPKKKLIVLEWLVERFAPDTRYPEAEVNAIIKRHHPDSSALRRELVDHRLMQREAGIYWRIDGDA